MKKFLLFSSLLASALALNAQVTPKVQPETPVDGNKYVLVNKAQSASQYTTRTSWDGALYFLGKEESHYADYALTAVKNDDGTWSFTLQNEVAGDETEEPTVETYYMVLPYGSANANVNSLNPVKWSLDPKEGGFYHLIAGEGNNSAALELAYCTPTKDLRLHLNNGCQYFVISYPGDSWFPDCYGGMEIDDVSADDVLFAAKDSISFNWGFLSVDKVPDYYADVEYSGTINKFYADYCDMDGYAEGFLATFNAVAALYNNAADADELAEAGIVEAINAKVALYNEIEAAIALNEDEDATLAAAIATAQNVFNTQTDAAAVENATKTLKEAEANYSLGTGDITALGTNMSFEDLSAQNGEQTTGVAGAPTGWKVYINGNEVVTADDASKAGMGAWHGVNNDAEGEPMDGNYAFGIWNSGIPTYEISQTIEGLETGTYEVTAGLMAGDNGNGSRLTTQRIFGNLNSTYYGNDYEYDLSELDNSEVYAFAGNEHINTDREMRFVTVKAFVYDGTLTFGVRTDGNIKATYRESGNPAGGDGWFKTDNFKIKTLGYNADDAIAIIDHYKDILDEYSDAKMAASVKENLEAQLGSLKGITAASSQEEIIAGIINAKDLFAPVNASVKAYEKLRSAIDQHFDYLDQYQNKAGAGEYSDVIYDAEAAWEDETLETEAEVDALIAALDAALQDCIQSDDIEEGQDLTEYIQNPSFEDLSNQGGNNSDGVANAPKGWNVYIDGVLCNTSAELNAAGVNNWCAINSGDNLESGNGVELPNGEIVYHQYTDGDHLWGIWASAVPVIELSQTIKGMPAGTYTLTADVVVQNDWAGMNLGTQRLFANDYVAMFGAEEDYIQNADEELYETFPADVRIAAEIDALNEEAELKHLTYAGNYSHDSYGLSSIPYTTTLTFGLAESGAITLGFRSSRISAVDGQLSSQASLGWFKLDNFRLTIDSFDVPAGAETTPEATDIDSIVNNEKATVEFYSINGARLSAPQKGINIVKMSNGTVSKVLVK